jgi:hypothetical protein
MPAIEITRKDLSISQLRRQRRARPTWLLKRTIAGNEASIAEQRANIRRAYLTATSTDSDVDKQIAKMELKWDAIV